MSRPLYKIPPRSVDTPFGVYDNLPPGPAEPLPERSRNVRRVGHSDMNGWGDTMTLQVRDGVLYSAHSGTDGHDGLTILDVKDPTKPKVVRQTADKTGIARSHKIALVENVFYTNMEKLPGAGMEDPELIGGLRIFDVEDPRNPKFVNYVEVEGRGIHRPIYDRARKLLYCSAFKDGCRGKVMQNYDVSDPFGPELLSEAWIEGQNEAAGETPSWDFDYVGWGCWLHEANPFGNYATCGFWNGGIAMFDMTDPCEPGFMWRHNPHETHGWPGSYHTFLVPPGSEFAIATTECCSIDCGHPPAFVTFYDIRNVHHPLPISTFHPYEIDPLTMHPLDQSWCDTGLKYGAHNVWLDMKKDDFMYIAWHNAGLRIVDCSNPFSPKEVGYYIPPGNSHRTVPQSNDVVVDPSTGLIYLGDRWGLGIDILEFTG